MANECKDRVQFAWLALRCQTGDPEAFADLIAVMERPLLYYATSLTGNQDAALDVLQDVWLGVVRGIRRLKDPSSLTPWHLRTVVLANISFTGMRAQNNPHALWRILAFIFGLPGTILTSFVVVEGSERAYGIDLPPAR
jgi:hypothetical protein